MILGSILSSGIVMQPVRTLERSIRSIQSPEHYLFSVADLGSLLPDLDRPALKMVLLRAVDTGVLARACRGIYLLADTPRTGYELYHIAAKLRAGYFNYISQETVLSELGIISQAPIQYITLMSSGASGIVDCGEFGRVEFTHSKKRFEELADRLSYDDRCMLLRADASLAFEDLRAARRNLHLVDEGALREHLV